MAQSVPGRGCCDGWATVAVAAAGVASCPAGGVVGRVTSLGFFHCFDVTWFDVVVVAAVDVHVVVVIDVAIVEQVWRGLK